MTNNPALDALERLNKSLWMYRHPSFLDDDIKTIRTALTNAPSECQMCGNTEGGHEKYCQPVQPSGEDVREAESQLRHRAIRFLNMHPQTSEELPGILLFLLKKFDRKVDPHGFLGLAHNLILVLMNERAAQSNMEKK